MKKLALLFIGFVLVFSLSAVLATEEDVLLIAPAPDEVATEESGEGSMSITEIPDEVEIISGEDITSEPVEEEDKFVEEEPVEDVEEAIPEEETATTETIGATTTTEEETASSSNNGSIVGAIIAVVIVVAVVAIAAILRKD